MIADLLAGGFAALLLFFVVVRPFLEDKLARALTRALGG